MPCRTRKQLALRRLGDTASAAVKHATKVKLFGESVCHLEGFILLVDSLRKQVQSNRHLSRLLCRKGVPKFECHLDRNHVMALNDEEFSFHFQMDRHSFWSLANEMDGHTIFANNKKGPSARPGAHQLLVLLKCMGTERNQANSKALSNFFGISKGSVPGHRNNAVKALLSLEPHTYFCPLPKDCKVIATRIEEKHLFQNCVGLIDGTLLPLRSRPLCHGENCWSQKILCVLVVLVVCNDNARMTHCHIGWPGSVHDNRVWRACKLCTNAPAHFSKDEHLLGDSAFMASRHMVPPFKTVSGKDLGNNPTEFNALLAKPRVKSEHCIGIMKGRFPFLRSMRLKFANKRNLAHIIRHIRVAVVLHNYMLGDFVDQEWVSNGEPDNLEPESLAVAPRNSAPN